LGGELASSTPSPLRPAIWRRLGRFAPKGSPSLDARPGVWYGQYSTCQAWNYKRRRGKIGRPLVVDRLKSVYPNEADPMSIGQSMEERANLFALRYAAVKEQLGRVIVGHDDIVHGVLTCLFVGGHCLLEGAPGLGKTLLVRTLSHVLDLNFSRIQFTPDLMPADILGTNMVLETPDGRRVFEFQKGPIFTQICLADEINRATPKTQSAMLETMQEGSVSIGGKVYQLDRPFFVMATQNPIEQEGTYPLPEAQLDRFFYKLVVGYSSREELSTILDRTTRGVSLQTEKVMDGPEILQWQQFIREVVLARHVQDYIVRLVLATHPDGPHAMDVTNKYLRWGASPRAAQTVALAAKVRALLNERYNVSFEDVRRTFLPALRHRVILNFEAEAEGITTDQVLLEILEKAPEKAEDQAAA
jgi:MoxR-like ATPase